MRRTPAPWLPLRVGFTVAGWPPRASTQLRISSWSVVVRAELVVRVGRPRAGVRRCGVLARARRREVVPRRVRRELALERERVRGDVVRAFIIPNSLIFARGAAKRHRWHFSTLQTHEQAAAAQWGEVLLREERVGGA